MFATHLSNIGREVLPGYVAASKTPILIQKYLLVSRRMITRIHTLSVMMNSISWTQESCIYSPLNTDFTTSVLCTEDNKNLHHQCYVLYWYILYISLVFAHNRLVCAKFLIMAKLIDYKLKFTNRVCYENRQY